MTMRREADHPLPPTGLTLEQRVEKLYEISEMLSIRISGLETGNVEMRAALGLDPPPPVIGSHWKTVKQVSFDTHYSEGGVWRWVRKRQVEFMKIGGRVFVNTRTLPEKIKKRPACFPQRG